MLPFRSGDPEPGGGSQHLGLDSVEFHPVINCLLSAFPHTAVNRLALKISTLVFMRVFISALASQQASQALLGLT